MFSINVSSNVIGVKESESNVSFSKFSSKGFLFTCRIVLCKVQFKKDGVTKLWIQVHRIVLTENNGVEKIIVLFVCLCRVKTALLISPCKSSGLYGTQV